MDGYTETSSNYRGDNEKNCGHSESHSGQDGNDGSNSGNNGNNCGDNSGGIENNREDNTKQSGMDFLVEQLDTEPKDIYDPDA